MCHDQVLRTASKVKKLAVLVSDCLEKAQNPQGVQVISNLQCNGMSACAASDQPLAWYGNTGELEFCPIQQAKGDQLLLHQKLEITLMNFGQPVLL